MTSDKQSILAALRGAKPQSDPIDIGNGVFVTLRMVADAIKDKLRDDARASVPPDAADRESRILRAFVPRLLHAAMAHHEISLEELSVIVSPVLRLLWAEYERLEAMVSPSSDAELDELRQEVKEIVGESRSAAVAYLSGLGYTTLLRYAISTVGQPSS